MTMKAAQRIKLIEKTAHAVSHGTRNQILADITVISDLTNWVYFYNHIEVGRLWKRNKINTAHTQ